MNNELKKVCLNNFTNGFIFGMIKWIKISIISGSRKIKNKFGLTVTIAFFFFCNSTPNKSKKIKIKSRK